MGKGAFEARLTDENNGSLGLFLKELYEPEARSLPALSRSDLELVSELTNDRDSQPALGEGLSADRQLVIDGETLPVIAHLDDETVRMKLVHDLDGTFPAVAIGVPNRVRARLRDRELEIAECFVVEGTQVRDAAESEPDERDVLGLRGDGEAHAAGVAVRTSCR
jgi:hypothetical protein